MNRLTRTLRRPDRRPRAWRFAPATEQARLVDEVDGGVRVEASRLQPPRALVQLERTHAFPGNLRWARRASESLLLADFAQGGATEASGLALALDGGDVVAVRDTAGFRNTSGCDVGDLRQSLLTTGLAEDALLARGASLEVRLPIAGIVRAVLVEAQELEWALHCPALKQIAGDDVVVADQALRINAQARYARLAVVGGAVVAQACVARPHAAPAFLLRSARAVAALAHHASFTLTTLHETPEVRAAYARLIACSRSSSRTAINPGPVPTQGEPS